MTKLKDLEAEILTIEYNGIMIETLFMQCPKEGCDHDICIPFHPTLMVHKEMYVWRQKSGSTIKDLTLAPSYILTGPNNCGLHGYVREGEWVNV